MAVLSKLSNSNRVEWEADEEQRSRCKTFNALKEALERIRASCDPTTCNLSTALVSSAHLSDHYYYYYYKNGPSDMENTAAQVVKELV